MLFFFLSFLGEVYFSLSLLSMTERGVGNIGRGGILGRAWDHRKEGEGGNHRRGEGYIKRVRGL